MQNQDRHTDSDGYLALTILSPTQCLADESLWLNQAILDDETDTPKLGVADSRPYSVEIHV
jgi:hypothetical protein